jgi:hypothetical protein
MLCPCRRVLLVRSQVETPSHVSDWLRSPGLQPPDYSAADRFAHPVQARSVAAHALSAYESSTTYGPPPVDALDENSTNRDAVNTRVGK